MPDMPGLTVNARCNAQYGANGTVTDALSDQITSAATEVFRDSPYPYSFGADIVRQGETQRDFLVGAYPDALRLRTAATFGVQIMNGAQALEGVGSVVSALKRDLACGDSSNTNTMTEIVRYGSLTALGSFSAATLAGVVGGGALTLGTGGAALAVLAISGLAAAAIDHWAAPMTEGLKSAGASAGTALRSGYDWAASGVNGVYDYFVGG